MYGGARGPMVYVPRPAFSIHLSFVSRLLFQGV